MLVLTVCVFGGVVLQVYGSEVILSNARKKSISFYVL